MKKIFFVILLLNTIISFSEKRTIHIQYCQNPQYDRSDSCCIFFNWRLFNNKFHTCRLEIEEQEGTQLNLKSVIERKLLEAGVFSAKYGQLHFYVDGKEVKDRKFDLNELNVVVVRQK